MLARVRSHLCPLAAALLLLAITSISAANPAPSRVAVVRPPAADEVAGDVTTRILAELSAAGFDVVEIDAPPDAIARSAVEAPSKAIATFAVERVGSRPAVDVWLSDQITGKTTVRRLDFESGTSDRASAILAIRAVDLLRASLLELMVPPKAPAEKPPEAPSDVTTFVRAASAPVREAPRGLLDGVGIEIDAGAIHGFSGVGPSAGIALRGSYGIGRFAARITLAGLEVGPTLRAPGGSATYGQEIGLVEGIYSGPVYGPLSAFLSAGAGAYHIHVKGSADPPNTAASPNLWSPAAAIGGGAGLRIAPGAAAVLSAHGVLTARRAAVDIAGVEAGRTGQPSLFATLGILATF
jgi:hypothetical protein